MRRLLILSLVLAACGNKETGLPPTDGGIVVDLSAPGPDLGPRTVPTKVDILFMIDDSGSTAPLQGALQVGFAQLAKGIDDAAVAGHKASYHIGVVTSDLGAPGISCGMNRGAKLQNPAAASTGCVPISGANYIEYDQIAGTNNFPAALDLQTTFDCISSVGDHGCGFEAPLEAVYRALHDPIAENAGFLRDDAALVVILMTNEDDCSVDATSDLFTDNPAYGPLASFRCTHFGIFCDGAMVNASASPYNSCTPATFAQGSKLTDLQKYVDFFTTPKSQGGVKSDPRNVILASIAAPVMPFSTETSTDPTFCGAGQPSCTLLSHSCASPTDSTIFGDPAVRIQRFVTSALTHTTGSVCDSQASTLSAIATQIGGLLTP